MNSFFFWLTLSAAVGALAGVLLRPGIPEITLTVVALNALFYGIRSALRSRRRHAAA